MKADLHVHSKFSKRPSEWILQKIGCPESFTEPLRIYEVAQKRGMSLVTITDHNAIEGALQLAHLPDFFVSEEITTYFPENGCKIHVLAYHITEKQHEDIQRLRENIFDLVPYLQQEKIIHVVAHPLYSINDRLTLEHFEKLLLLFKNFELNGARDNMQNQYLQIIFKQIQPSDIIKLVEKHRIVPSFPKPWEKNLVGGSDDHSSLNIARTHTFIENARDVEDFLGGIESGKAKVIGRESTPLTLAQNLYGIAYQFYKQKFNLVRHVNKDPIIRLLDRFLEGSQDAKNGVKSRLYFMLQKNYQKARPGIPKTILQLFKNEAQKMIWDNADILKILNNGNGDLEKTEKRWFEFVNQVSNKMLVHFGNTLFDQLSNLNFISIFNTLSSAGILYSLLAPYFVSFSVFSQDKGFNQKVLQRFVPQKAVEMKEKKRVKVAHFTDTFYDVNGVAINLQHSVQAALKTGKRLTVITCDTKDQVEAIGVKNFHPVGIYDLPEYPDQKLYYPPFLEILNYCYEEGFTHIHTATPGPIGLAAMAIARILKLPLIGTYHTSLPQYAWYLTEDNAIEDLMWKYVLWYYDQMDFIMVPSKSTKRELVEKGINAKKIRLYPRGIDVERFHPSKGFKVCKDGYNLGNGFRLLYVGRVSKEKNLQLLSKVFKSLIQTHDDVSLIIVGDGPFLEEMKNDLRGTPAFFTGYLKGEKLAAVYATCDLFVFPSTTDTFGNVIMEAQASGLPVIVTDAGGPQENLVPGKTGIVVPSNDEVAFLNAIQSLLSDTQNLRKMSREARKNMEKRSFQKSFEKVWQIYEERFSKHECPALV